MTMNIEQIRKDLPHYEDSLFLNSAGSSLMPHSVVEKINHYLREEEAWGGYLVAERAADSLADFYSQVAQLIGSQPHNIAFAHSATDAYTQALSSIRFEPGDTIITTDDDYASNHIQFISLRQRYGINTVRAQNLPNGDLDLEGFQRLVEEHSPRLVAVTHVPTNSGLVQDVEAVGKICQDHQVIFLVDACQSAGQLDIDVRRLRCDFLTATGRKFLRGPRGTGFLYVSDRMLEEGYFPLMIDGRGAVWKEADAFEIIPTAQRFETWEASFALVVGLGEAIRYANQVGITHIESYNRSLMRALRSNLSAIAGVRTYDRGSQTCNILTFRKENRSLEATQKILDENQVRYSVSQKAWGLLDFEKKNVDWVIRLSPHYFNTVEEIDRVSQVIDRL